MRAREYHEGIRFALNPGSSQCYQSKRDRQTVVSLAKQEAHCGVVWVRYGGKVLS